MNNPEALKAECIALVHQISQSRYNVKLLLSARAALLLVAGYKAGRGQKMCDRMTRSKRE